MSSKININNNNVPTVQESERIVEGGEGIQEMQRTRWLRVKRPVARRLRFDAQEDQAA